MTFKYWDGKTECQTFADFYAWMQNPDHNRKCPACGTTMDIHTYPTFDMNKYGRAICQCPNKFCEYNRQPIIIESTRS